MYRGLPIVQHGGSFIGFRAQLMRFPAEHVSIAVLCNDASANADRLAQLVADSYLATRLGAAPVPPPAPAPQTSSAPAVEIAPPGLERFVGRYAVQPGLLATVRRVDGGLRLGLGGLDLPMTPTSPTTFNLPPPVGELEFVVDGENVSVWFKPYPPAPKLVLPDLSAADLAKYSGRYASAELDTWFLIRTAPDGLELRRRYGPWARLEQIAADRFVTGPAELRFERDGNSEPTSFVVLTQRASNIRFARDAGAYAR
jgi:hypothetical protein